MNYLALIWQTYATINQRTKIEVYHSVAVENFGQLKRYGLSLLTFYKLASYFYVTTEM